MTVSIYVVYITTYKGTLLPPFYIGSTSLRRIERGYGGSVSSRKYRDIWKSERQDNPQLFETRVISEHKTRAEAVDAERDAQLIVGAAASPFFMNMSTAGSGTPFNNSGRKMSEKTRAALRAANTGREVSDQTRQKMSEARAKRVTTDETRAKLRAAASARAPRKFSEEARKRISEAAKRRPPPSAETRLKRSLAMKATLAQRASSQESRPRTA